MPTPAPSDSSVFLDVYLTADSNRLLDKCPSNVTLAGHIIPGVPSWQLPAAQMPQLAAHRTDSDQVQA
jgi:hypothetical protein